MTQEETAISIVVGALGTGAISYLFYMLKRNVDITDKALSKLADDDKFNLNKIEILQKHIEELKAEVALNKQKDSMTEKFLHRELQILQADIHSIRDGLEQRITKMSDNMETFYSRMNSWMDKQDERWKQFYENQNKTK